MLISGCSIRSATLVLTWELQILSSTHVTYPNVNPNPNVAKRGKKTWNLSVLTTGINSTCKDASLPGAVAGHRQATPYIVISPADLTRVL